MNSEINLLNFRKKINKIDKKIINLLFERNNISKKIAKIKICIKKNIKDKNREKEILLNIYNKSKKYNISKKYIKKIFRTIIKYSIKIQKKIFGKLITKKISLLGPKGSYSYYALKKYCKKKNIYKKKLKYTNFKNVEKYVKEKKTEIAILPIENSNTGKINEIYDILEKTKLFIVEMIYLKINHCLFSKKNIKIKKIKTIYTHIQPFLQCEKFIKKFYKESNIKFMKSTSFAIKKIINKQDNNVAAIGNKKNINLFKLKILKKNINDEKKNFTKFIILKKKNVELKNKKNILLIRFSYKNNKFPNKIFYILYKNKIEIKTVICNKSKIKNYKNIYFIELINNSYLIKNINFILKKMLKISKNIKIIGNYKNKNLI
ncbi:prephenate dehydratase domain-containing protein [Buchnera aphidicola (Ceratovacuna keduensis)]|uniref:prephenate dehydratase domain-containing protein n=1 Tax=Buchnera aphidicola TaxID=9 RepID=UPI0031B802A3